MKRARTLQTVGSALMMLGAVEPLEGSLLILLGSVLVFMGALLGQRHDPLMKYTTWAFVLIVFGIAALWGLTMAGGFGGSTGRSVWWALLILPYPVGWSVSVWGPASVSWMRVAGVLIGLWYVVICGILLSGPTRPTGDAPAYIIGTIGVLTVAGCSYRLRRENSAVNPRSAV